MKDIKDEMIVAKKALETAWIALIRVSDAVDKRSPETFHDGVIIGKLMVYRQEIINVLTWLEAHIDVEGSEQ